MATKPRDKEGEIALLAGVIAQRAGAWQDFFKQHERLILACLRRVYRRYHVPMTPDHLEDLTAMVCLDLVRDDYKKLRKFDPERGYRLSSWVGLIATNIAHDALRRRGPMHISTDDEERPLAELTSQGPDPLEIVDQRQRVELLAQAIGQLTQTDQDFVRLYYAEQRSPDEIAETTGVSVNTVYSRKNKVRRKLTKIISTMTRADKLRESG